VQRQFKNAGGNPRHGMKGTRGERGGGVSVGEKLAGLFQGRASE